MFRASLCPSSGEQRPCNCIWCTALVLLDVVGSGCGALRCRMRGLLASEYKYTDTSQPELFFLHLPRKMEPIEGSETSAFKPQTPGKYPQKNILQFMLSLSCSIFPVFNSPHRSSHENNQINSTTSTRNLQWKTVQYEQTFRSNCLNEWCGNLFCVSLSSVSMTDSTQRRIFRRRIKLEENCC